MKKNPLVSIVGYGKVGAAVAERLWEHTFGIHSVAMGYKKEMLTTNFGEKICVETPSDYYDNLCGKSVNYLVVCLPGDALEEQIDDLLLMKIPLVILSTNYDENVVRKKCIEANISCVMSSNMALPILDFWNILGSLNTVEAEGIVNILYAIESHPGFKADISGSLVKTLSILESKGIKNDCDLVEAKSNYKQYKDNSNGCVMWYREAETQKEEYPYFIKNKYIEDSGHGYHEYAISGDHSKNAKIYLEYIYLKLKRLEDYSNEHLQVIIELSNSKNILYITHNINGRSIYGDGVSECIEFIENGNKGVFTGNDVLKTLVNK